MGIKKRLIFSTKTMRTWKTFLLRFTPSTSQTVIWIGLSLNLAALIASFWNVESPAWLASVGEEEKAKRNIQYIAMFNGVQDMHIKQLMPDEFGFEESN